MPLVVNGETVDDSLIREEANNLRPSYTQMMDEGDPIALEIQLREWSRENVIERVLLRQASPDGDVEKLLAQVVAPIPPPKYKEVGDYYKKHKEEFFTPEMVRASHILEPVDETHDQEIALATIEKVDADLRAGLVFDSLAQDLGWLPRGRVSEDLENEIFALEPGDTTGILRSNAGFHIVRVHEYREAGIPGLQDLREHIEGMLLRSRQQLAIENFIDSLKAKAQITK